MAKKKPQLKKTKRLKPELAGGFRDYGPEEALARRAALDAIRSAFERFGFDPLETPAVEKTSVLLGGESESEKIIFNVRGSKEKLARKSELSLRFDLTVPLARFIAANPDIPKPFRRYQIGPVWRGESPQAGRYREFLQADADIAGSSSRAADAEVIAVAYEILKALGLENFTIRINNRKILESLPAFAGFPQTKLASALRIIDKRDKIGDEAVKRELSKSFSAAVSETIVDEFLKTGPLLGENARAAETALEGVRELDEIEDNLASLGVPKSALLRDFSVVRGLGYYTGPVFEITLDESPELGSVVAGGRYDALTVPFTGQKLPSVGVSIGIDRLFTALSALNTLPRKQTATRVLVLSLSEALIPDCLAIAKILRDAGVPSAVYLGEDRALKAQFAYAVKKEIPFAVIYGELEKERGIVKVKNLATREEREIPKTSLADFFVG